MISPASILMPPILALGVSAHGVAAPAIITRHDRDDARYIELARHYRCAGAVAPDGVCTLIAPDWVLTAAHVAQDLSPFSRGVRFGSAPYRVQRVILHPSWTGRPGAGSIDMALMHLETPVDGVTPAAVYTEADETGQPVLFLGNGDYGDGRTGPRGFDGQWRAATNTVAEAPGGWLRFYFDAPPEATDLEGISGPGDSGGPALLEREGRAFIIGVGSYNRSAGVGECQYGSNDFYARVSAAQEWIEQTMRSPPASDLTFPAPTLLGDAGWPDSPAGRIARAFFAAYGDDVRLADFERTHRSAEALTERPVEERVGSWRAHHDRLGDLAPHSYVARGEGDLTVLARAARGTEWVSLRFMLEDVPPHKLVGIGIGRDQPPEVLPDSPGPP